MLESALGIEFGMARKMRLAILADDLGRLVGQDAGVEMTTVRRQFGIAEAHRHSIFGSAGKQRHRRRIRHLPLEPGIDLRLVLDVPAREKRRQRQFRIDDQISPARLGFVHERKHARNDGLTALGTLNGAHLSSGDIDDTHGRAFPLLLSRAAMIKNRAHFCSAYQDLKS
jgi:hypothetical protein